MANQLNYSERLVSLENQRPFRPTKKDQDLTVRGSKTIWFGTDPNDNVELWIYNVDGSIAGFLRLMADDPALSLYTVADVSGGYEYLNIDFGDVLNRMAIQPGRYSMVANFFRDEIGGLEKYKLYIDEISPSRTELRLRSVDPTNEILGDIYEFVVPSVPKLYAQGLVDQLFEKNIDVVSNEAITVSSILRSLDELSPGTSARLQRSASMEIFGNLFEGVRAETYLQVIEGMVADIENKNIQENDLREYIDSALDKVLTILIDQTQIDPRFELI